MEIFCFERSKNLTKPRNQPQKSRTDSIDAEMSTEKTMLRFWAWQFVGPAGAYWLPYPPFPLSFPVVKVSKKNSLVVETGGIVVVV